MSTVTCHLGTRCILDGPPETGFWDRVALWLEGGGKGQDAPNLVDLAQVMEPEELREVAPSIARFYAEPSAFELRTGIDMSRWSRLWMRAFAILFRQSGAPDRGPGFEGFAVCQRVYVDAQGRLHWDRYARVDGALRRLFVARMGVAAGRISETFVLYGVPVTLVFGVRRDGDGLVLTLKRRESSPAAWVSRVEYRTSLASGGGELETRGDFRVPLLGLRVRMTFRMRPA